MSFFNKKNIFILLTISPLLLLSNSTMANIYFGATIGQVDSDDDTGASEFSYFAYTNITNEDSETTDTTFSLFAGYELNNENVDLSVEAGFIDLGEYTLSASGNDFLPGGTGTRSADIKTSAEAITLAFVAKQKTQNKFKVFGKLGIAAWDFEGSVNGVVYDAAGNISGTTSYSASDSGTDIFFGLGINYKDIFLSFDRYDLDGSKINYISLGYKF